MTLIRIRGDTAANWTSVNPVLAYKEIAAELDTLKLKIGDGSTAWNSLAYVTGAGAYSDEQAQDAVGAMVDATLVYVDGTPLLTRAALTGDVSASQGSNSVTVTKINGVSLAGLGTGILKNTTGTGAPSIAAAGDFPTLNQNTTGSAAKLTTARTIAATGDVTWSGSFDGSANFSVTATIANNTVTYAKMQDVSATNRFLGRITAGAGDPEELTAAQAKTILGIVASDVGSGAALTKTDDTNVTLTLGGTPASALLAAASITAGWTGTLAATRGGTGTGTYALGDLLYSSATNTLAKLAGNTTATKQFLSQTGTGTVSAAPAWGALVAGDIPNIAESQVTNLTSDLALKAPLASPAFTGNWTASGRLGIANTIQVTGATNPSSGVGMELGWLGTTSRVQSFDRTGGTYQPLQLSASQVDTSISGSVVASVTSTGLSVTGASLSTGNQLISGTGAQGYATGSGGTVTQLTSKSTGVTLNKTNGQIVTHNAALASAAVVTFTVSNSTVAATDTINLCLASGNATAGTYRYWIDKVSATSFVVAIENRSAGSLSEALTFNFAVVKAVTS